MSISGPYNRFNFPTWRDLGVLEEAIKEIKRSPLPVTSDLDQCYGDSQKQRQKQEPASLPSVFNLLGSYIRQYVEGDECQNLTEKISSGKFIDPVDTRELEIALNYISEDEHEDDDNVVIVQVAKEQGLDDPSYRVHEEVSQLKSVLTPEGFLTFETPFENPQDSQDELSDDDDFESADYDD